MKLEAKREQLLKPLQHVIGAVERRQTLPILTNVLVSARERELTLTTTDLEMELSVRVELQVETPGETTLPARRLHDILRALPDDASVTLSVEGDKATVRCGRSRFTLITLPAGDFPTLEDLPFEGDIRLPQGILRSLIERTHFAMAQQDVRYYLNGLLLVVAGGELRVVATDGHRLAYASEPIDENLARTEAILPRKTVLELARQLADSDEPLEILLGGNQVTFRFGAVELVSKLIDGKFPDYERVIPQGHPKLLTVPRLTLLHSLERAAILTNEKFRGVRTVLAEGSLKIIAANAEQEEAVEEIEIDYSGEALDVGFNVTYLLDVLRNVSNENVECRLNDSNSSALITLPGNERFKYVVMPMRI